MYKSTAAIVFFCQSRQVFLEATATTTATTKYSMGGNRAMTSIKMALNFVLRF